MNYLEIIQKAIAATPTENELRNSPDVGTLITKLYDYLIPASVAVAGLMMIYAGYLYITSEGNPDGTKAAKEIIIGALVGLALIILAGLILQTVVGVPSTLST